VFNDETCKCECDPTQRCCGILLNTVVPFIGDCIEMTTQNSISDPSDPNKSRVNQLNAFPFLMMWLSKILVTIILIFSFLIIIAAWLMMTTGVYKEQNYKTWVDRITKVIVWLILLWASGLILRLINPSFFGW
jgi:magnesium-transporting ATPase (P-type)